MRVHILRLLAIMLLGAACEKPIDPFDPSYGVVSVTVQPKVATLYVGDSVQLTSAVIMSTTVRLAR